MFPLLVVGTIFAFQFTASQTAKNLDQEKLLKEQKLALLQPVLREQRELRNRQQQLNELISIAQSVRENRIIWSAEVAAMLELLPARGGAPRPTIDFTSLNLRSIVPATVDENRYEGEAVVGEMKVSGNVVDSAVLAQYIRALESSQQFGVLFQTTTRVDEREDLELYQYQLTVGLLAGEVR
ncbi:MAG: hypothetical protein JSV66_14365 [Trueperaceae bacterium]|nr:MAG: hypothetical protein JSV66_14365 [Trueperaceae bacterium]